MENVSTMEMEEVPWDMDLTHTTYTLWEWIFRVFGPFQGTFRGLALEKRHQLRHWGWQPTWRRREGLFSVGMCLPRPHFEPERDHRPPSSLELLREDVGCQDTLKTTPKRG